MPKSLFHITDDIRLLSQALDDAEGDAEATETIVAFLEEAKDELKTKLDGYIEFIRDRQHRAQHLRERAAELISLAQVEENKVTRLKDGLMRCLDAQGLKTLETEYNKVSVVNNGGTAPIRIADSVMPSDVPERFHKVMTTIDLAAVREALESGEQLDFASLGDRGRHIRIK